MTTQENTDLIAAAKAFREAAHPDVSVAAGSIIGLWLRTADALEASEQSVLELKGLGASRENLLKYVGVEINGLLDSLDEHVIADEGERENVYTAINNVRALVEGSRE